MYGLRTKMKFYNNVLNAIKDKIQKYDDNYSKNPALSDYNEYNLIIYAGDVPSTLNNEEINELENYINVNVNNLRFDNIIIIMFKIFLIISEDRKFKIIHY